MVGNMVRRNTKQEITYVIQTIGEGKRYVIAQRFMGSQPSNSTQQNYKSTTKNIIRTKRKCILQLYWLLGNICNIVLSPHASTMGYFDLHTS